MRARHQILLDLQKQFGEVREAHHHQALMATAGRNEQRQVSLTEEEEVQNEVVWKHDHRLLLMSAVNMHLSLVS